MTSFWIWARSASVFVSFALCTDSSRTRCRMECDSFSAPSAVWMRLMAFWAFSLALLRPLTWPRSFSLMARPAASSAARLMRKPEDSFSRLLLIWPSVTERFR